MKRGAFAYQRFAIRPCCKCVWSENISKALRYAEDIDAGMVWVNMHTFLDPAVPFGDEMTGIGREFGSVY